ncbi:MAG TPA: protoporphyrinogen oxidase [Blastocatellia bacterium]|nr:protoporphyrinogen oxidase [Blastocatellia bacterium]
MVSRHSKAAVIGAGISGLTCAFRLKSLGVNVVAMDASDRAGGVMHSEVVDGYLIERGPNSSQGTLEVLDLVSELGIEDDLLEGDPKAPAYVYFDEQLHPVPAGLGSLIKSDLLSAGGKLRLLAEPFKRRSRIEGEESLHSFVSRRLGKQVAERLVAPFTSGIYAGDAHKLSVQATFPSLAKLESEHGSLLRGMIRGAVGGRKPKAPRVAEPARKPRRRKRLVSFRNGMGSLPQALASKLGEDLILGCRNIQLGLLDGSNEQVAGHKDNRGETNSGFKITFERRGVPEELTCDRLIIAAPALAAAGLLGPISNEMARLLQPIEHPPLAIAYLAFDRESIPVSTNGFGFLAAPGQGLEILGCVYSSSLFKGRSPSGMTLLTVFIGGARNTGISELSDSNVVEAIRKDLDQSLGIEDEPKVIGVTRYDRSIPQYNIGHAERVRKIHELAGGIRGLTLIGNYLHGVSTGDCIKEAERAAHSIASQQRAEDTP